MNLRSLIIRWNNEHPLDKKFREKHNIAFNSPQHRKINQIDILIEYIEEQVFKEFQQTIETQAIKKKQYELGQWISEEELSIEESEDLFAKMDIDQINENSKFQVEE